MYKRGQDLQYAAERETGLTNLGEQSSSSEHLEGESYSGICCTSY